MSGATETQAANMEEGLETKSSHFQASGNKAICMHKPEHVNRSARASLQDTYQPCQVDSYENSVQRIAGIFLKCQKSVC